MNFFVVLYLVNGSCYMNICLNDCVEFGIKFLGCLEFGDRINRIRFFLKLIMSLWKKGLYVFEFESWDLGFRYRWKGIFFCFVRIKECREKN